MRPPGYNTIEKLPEDYTPSAPPPSEVTGTPSEPAITPGGSQPAGHGIYTLMRVHLECLFVCYDIIT